MVSLEKVFVRFPKLTENQRTEICRRRIVKLLENIPPGLDVKLDSYYALGYLGTKNLFRSYK